MLPWDDLERILRARRPHTNGSRRVQNDPYIRASDPELAEEAGVSAQTIIRMRQRGYVDAIVAERIAEHLGEHPVGIWGWAWWSHVDDSGVVRRGEVTPC